MYLIKVILNFYYKLAIQWNVEVGMIINENESSSAHNILNTTKLNKQ